MTIPEVQPELPPEYQNFTFIKPVVTGRIDNAEKIAQLNAGIVLDIHTLRENKKPLKLVLDATHIESLIVKGSEAIRETLQKEQAELILANDPDIVHLSFAFAGMNPNRITL